MQINYVQTIGFLAETVEESTSSQTELRKLHLFIKQQQDEIEKLRIERQQSPHHVPQVSVTCCFRTVIRNTNCLGGGHVKGPQSMLIMNKL